MRFFFYGTLMDRELLRRVLGRAVSARSLRPACLHGWRRCKARGHDYPVVRRCRGASVGGFVLDGVRPAEAARLEAYEGEGYRIARAVVETAGGGRRPARLFVPKPGFYALSHAAWSFAGWRRDLRNPRGKPLPSHRSEAHDPSS